MSVSSFFFLSLLSLSGGIIFSLISPFLWVAGLILYLFLFIYKKDIGWIFLIIFFALGFLRGYFETSAIKESPLLKLNDTQKNLIFIGKIQNEPEVKERYQRFIFQPEKIKGKILVYTDKKKRYKKGEVVEIEGKIETPPVFKDFDYRKYLERKGILSICPWPKISLKKEADIFQRSIFALKNKARKITETYLPEPESYLLEAMILGDKYKLPNDLKEDLNRAGIRHITAISGMHIMILIKILLTILLALGLKRKQAGIFVIFFIFFYLFFVGFQPSIVRASIMGFGLILSQILGRMPDSTRFLSLAAAIMLFINPFVFFDIGFQLSFLAALGINYLTPFFSHKLRFVTNKFGMRSILATSLSAQIFTLPIILYYFAYFSFLSFVANSLILPILPFVLGLGFLAVFLGFIFSPLSLFAFFPLSLLLAYIIFVAHNLAQISFLSLNFKLPLFLLLIYYGILLFVVRRIIKKERYWFLEY